MKSPRSAEMRKRVCSQASLRLGKTSVDWPDAHVAEAASSVQRARRERGSDGPNVTGFYLGPCPVPHLTVEDEIGSLSSMCNVANWSSAEPHL